MSIGKILPPSSKRVQLHTSKKINKKIIKDIIKKIIEYENANYDQLTLRIKQLDREWDTERVLEANASAIIFMSTILGFIFSVYWFILVGFISFFLFVHAVQGWCPPLPIIRRLGVRTPEEIYLEKYVLKLLRENHKEIDYVNLIKSNLI